MMGEEPPAAAASTTPEDPGASYPSAFDKLVSAGLRPVPDGAVYTCPRCSKVSHNPKDVTYRYCGACHWSEDWGERPQ